VNIVLGGPEISYDYEEYLLNGIANFIVINEGELAFEKLIKHLSGEYNIYDVENIAYLENGIVKQNQLMQIEDLNQLKDPFFQEDIKDISKKVQYIELSRGCPYKCSYCLASLEKGLRFFNIDKVFDQIDYLVNHGARTIKFLDRSFNANKKIALSFFKKLIEKNYSNCIFQFEINGDVLDDDIIECLQKYLKQNYIRFELGIQSTNPSVNKAVDRYQNTEKLIENIKKLQLSNIILHLDLIAGLPFEDLNSFKNTFNDIFNLNAKELQLGFLKMLKGTKIRRESGKHEYIFDENPPYEIIHNKYISSDELNQIHLVETFLDIYWNKGFMCETIKLLLKNNNLAYEFLYDLGLYYQKLKFSKKRYQLIDIYKNIKEYLEYNKIYNMEIDAQLKLDYLNYNKIKPKPFWNEKLNKNDIIRSFFKCDSSFNIDILYKYSLVTKFKSGYLIALFLPNVKEFYVFENNQIKRIG
jgi:anaerobic magnesium-protoporphyrin IX monomethyl ester cyclase